MPPGSHGQVSLMVFFLSVALGGSSPILPNSSVHQPLSDFLAFILILSEDPSANLDTIWF